MEGLKVLVAGKNAPGDDTIRELASALVECGTQPVLSSGEEILSGAHDAFDPDLLLLHAELTKKEVGFVRDRWQRSCDPPGALLFCGPDHVTLEPHLDQGLDYILPPFTPGLVRNRLTSGYERRRLARAVGDLEPSLDLLLHERDLRIGRRIQEGFLPAELPCPTGWEVAARFEPAREVSGDFYDGFSMANGRRAAFLVADVCDKGIGSALFMALMRTLLRHSAENWWTGALAPFLLPGRQGFLGSPGIGAVPLLAAVRGTNHYLTTHHLSQAYFVTLFFCVTDPATGRILYINGGHNPPILQRASGGHRLLRATGPAVGLWSDAVFTIAAGTLGPADTLFMYTDGVTEARNEEGELFGLPRLVNLLDGMSGAPAEEVVTQVLAEVRAHTGRAPQSDDITMLVLRRCP
ncbi:PP2C family protein-serine/threonine phosphatase [Spongiactinospora sp. TRM90649]|uniref:PP2C family protein-serine/threonine phosphatase n=1 Tax=Spongiactinospora sp. TRM90649 TaxID=3031114 RepID=UPI0023F817E7|nr:PP2C family protein-serine/threonine phosphatase [Spongiactinospora sp. TRM90649]MDF5752079.1 PP2C family protein-serine/threonine phosphatase [Spongiactinospora sp. TRM90649]